MDYATVKIREGGNDEATNHRCRGDHPECHFLEGAGEDLQFLPYRPLPILMYGMGMKKRIVKMEQVTSKRQNVVESRWWHPLHLGLHIRTSWEHPLYAMFMKLNARTSSWYSCLTNFLLVLSLSESIKLSFRTSIMSPIS